MNPLTAVVGIAFVIIGVAQVALSQRPVDCPRLCLQVYEPVCGSDGNTYGNECGLLNEAECNDHDVRKVYDGPCSIDGESSQDCPLFCIEVYEPVCGSDGNTYGNECELLNEAECKGLDVYKMSDGPCSTDGVSSQAPCSLACYEIYSPVCGSDGKTYVNECMLTRRSKCEDASLYMVSRGKCSDSVTQPEPCSLACGEIYSPVCGSDGKTYANECELTRQIKCEDASLYMVSRGECSNPVTGPAGQLWCPQEYPGNTSMPEDCSRHEDCQPGFGCCWLEDCPFGSCCVELVKEPADCLDGDYNIYGEEMFLRHGERQEVGDDWCPASCFCENGRILCAVPQCVAPPLSLEALFRFLCPSLLILAFVVVLCVAKVSLVRYRSIRQQPSLKTPGSLEDKPPAYGEAVDMPPHSPAVIPVDGNIPPSYEQAVRMA